MLQFFDTLTDDSGNALLGATVQVLNWPALTNATIYNTNGTASPVANNTVVADITGQINFYAPDGAYQLVYSYKGTPYKTRSPVQLTDPLSFVSFTETGAANAYVLTDSRLSVSLYAGLKVEIIAANSCTGASTFNLNATGAVAIVQSGGTPLVAGNIVATGIYRLEYDGTHWQLVSLQPVTAALIGGLLYPQTAQETTAGVAAVNTLYPGPGQSEAIHVFRYFTTAQIADVQARTLTQDVTSAIQAACTGISATGGTIYFPPGNYLISSAITVAGSSTRLTGSARAVQNYTAGAIIVASANVQFFTVTGSWVLIENLGMYCSNAAHTNPHINMTTGNFMSVVNCYLQGVNSSGAATGGGVTFGAGGDAGNIERCVIDQGEVNVNTSDVHLTSSWLWANTRPYAVKVNGGSNCTILGCDILPPQTNVANIKAGIYVTGAALQCKIIGCYLDGNATLNTGPGILIEAGSLNCLVADCHANLLTDWAIILDSLVNPIVHHCTFYNGNRGRATLNGTVPGDVLLRQTGSQAMSFPTVSDNKHLYTTAPGGTAGPAIRVLTGTAQNGMLLERNMIDDPTLGGYSAQGIVLDDGLFSGPMAGSLSKCIHAQRTACANGSAAFVITNTSVTISWGVNLFYQPRPDQVRVIIVGQTMAFQIAVLNALQIQVTFASAPGSGTVYASVDLN